MQDAQCNPRLPAAGLVILTALFLFSGFAFSKDGESTPLVFESGNCLIIGESTGDGGHEPGLSRNEQGIPTAPLVGACHSAIPANPRLAHCASFPVLPQAPPLA